MTSKTDEYLESVIKDAFKRELEVDENIARTLPFFAATLALVATLYSFILSRILPLSFSWLSVVLHILLALAAVVMIWVLWQLFQAVRQREFRLPPKETEILDWVEGLQDFYKKDGLTPNNVDARVATQLRQWLTVEFAEAAEHNRTANKPKLAARANGFTALVALLVIAFSTIGIIFVSQRVVADPKEPDHAQAASSIPRSSDRQPAGGAQGNAAATAEVASRAGGGEVPVGANGQHRGQMTNPTSSQGGKQPPAAATTSPDRKPPQPPTHQILKKGEDGGGALTKSR